MTTSLPFSRSYFQGSTNSAEANSSAETDRPSSSGPSVRRDSTSGSWVAMTGLPLISDRSTQADAAPAAAVVLGDLGLAGLGDQAADQRLGRLALGLRLEVGADPVAEHR